jgi:hypothetical protein
VSEAARELRANLDAACASIAVTAFIVAYLLKPAALCGDGSNPSTSFMVTAYVSVIGFGIASLLCLACRQLVGAKIAGLLVGLIVTVIALVALVLAASPTGLGLQENSPDYVSIQDRLRDAATSDVPGRRTYWLGATFRGARLNSISYPGPEVSYKAWDEQGKIVLEIAVMTYRRRAPTVQNYVPDQASIVLHTQSNQDVRVRFATPAKPDAALIAQARAAARAIPVRVTYEGCFSG